jgi:hypothetical protein
MTFLLRIKSPYFLTNVVFIRPEFGHIKVVFFIYAKISVEKKADDISLDIAGPDFFFKIRS